MPITVISTEGVMLTWTPLLEVPVQLDYHLQDVINSVMRGIEEAGRGEGTMLTDADLPLDNEADDE